MFGSRSKNNAESLVVDDELGFIKWAQENADELLKYSAPEIRKSDTKRLVQGGEKHPLRTPDPHQERHYQIRRIA